MLLIAGMKTRFGLASAYLPSLPAFSNNVSSNTDFESGGGIFTGGSDAVRVRPPDACPAEDVAGREAGPAPRPGDERPWERAVDPSSPADLLAM